MYISNFIKLSDIYFCILSIKEFYTNRKLMGILIYALHVSRYLRLFIYRSQSHLLLLIYKLYSFLYWLWIQQYLKKYCSMHARIIQAACYYRLNKGWTKFKNGWSKQTWIFLEHNMLLIKHIIFMFRMWEFDWIHAKWFIRAILVQCV